MTASSIISGTNFSVILFANPSAIAVFPTPGSPTNKGLFFCLLHKICIVLSNSELLPTSLSILPFLDFSFRLIQN